MDAEGRGVLSREYALSLDNQDSLSHIRDQFLLPSKAQLKAKSLHEAASRDTSSADGHDSSVYLCGNSLGPQPKLVSKRLEQHLATWSSQGVFGHFKPLSESPLPTWLDADAKASESIAPIVGAQASEVAVMQTLTANLHFLMSAFYKPDPSRRHKIILETKAFPSDHFVVESQVRHHNLDPQSSMVTVSSSTSEPTLTTDQIISIIDAHAKDTALLLLPGIQFYTGQLLDIPLVTSHARSLGIFVLWDLAHAVGNVPLQLHDWGVDAAAWCTYKYLNSGPGTIGGLFVHERHATSKVNRLAGWWGSSKSTRFAMDNAYTPTPGAAGFQLSNPSILDITALNASLEVFAMAGGMQPLRAKSVKLTAHLESLLIGSKPFSEKRFSIITPSDPEQRGAQLSLRLEAGLLDVVMRELIDRGVVVDERQPDVIRVAPAPLFNSFLDCWLFIDAFSQALEAAVKAKQGKTDTKGTDELLNTT